MANFDVKICSMCSMYTLVHETKKVKEKYRSTHNCNPTDKTANRDAF